MDWKKFRLADIGKLFTSTFGELKDHLPQILTKQKFFEMRQEWKAQQERELRAEYGLEVNRIEGESNIPYHQDPFYSELQVREKENYENLIPKKIKEQWKESGKLDRIQASIRYFKSQGYFTSYNTIDLLRDQEDETREYIQDAAYIKARKDPVASAIFERMAEYIIGKGIKFKTQHSKIQRVLEEFWRENGMELKQKDMVYRTEIESEFFPVLFTDENEGKTYLREVPPNQITDIELHPDDSWTRLSYKREFSIDADGLHQEGGGNVRYYPDIEYNKQLQRKGAVGSEHQRKSEWQRNAYMMYIRLGKNREKRSYVLAERWLKWAKYSNNFVKDRAVLNHERSRVVWIKKVRSTFSDALSRFKPAPSSGYMLVETDDVTYEAVNANINAADAKDDGLLLDYRVSAGAGQPLHIWQQRDDQNVYACNSEDTEVLTKDGWKTYSEISENDYVATVNQDTHKMEYQKPNDIFIYDHDGEMIKISSRGTEALVTPNHRLWYSNKPKSEKGWKFNTYENINIKQISVRSGLNWEDDADDYEKFEKITIGDTIYEGDDFLKFLGYYIGDGYAGHYEYDTYKNSKVGFHVEKERKYNDYSSVLEKFSFNMNIRDTGYHWEKTDKEMVSWLSDYCGKKCENKTIPDFVLNLPKDQLKIFFNSLMKSDGSFDKRKGRTVKTYTTISKQLSEKVMLIGLRLGYRTYIKERSDKRENRKNVFYVRMSDHKLETINTTNNFERVEYKGKVWSLNINNSNYVSRRKGKIAVHGNSLKQGTLPFNQQIIDRQDLWGEHFKKMFSIVIQTAVRAKRIPKQVVVTKFIDSDIREMWRRQFLQYKQDTIDAEQLFYSADRYLQDFEDQILEDELYKDLPELKEHIVEECQQTLKKCRLIESEILLEELVNLDKLRIWKGKDDITEEVQYKIADTHSRGESAKDVLREINHIMERGINVLIDSKDVPIDITFPDHVKEDQFDQAKTLKLHKELGASNPSILSKLSYNAEEEISKQKQWNEVMPEMGSEENPDFNTDTNENPNDEIDNTGEPDEE